MEQIFAPNIETNNTYHYCFALNINHTKKIKSSIPNNCNTYNLIFKLSRWALTYNLLLV